MSGNALFSKQGLCFTAFVFCLFVSLQTAFAVNNAVSVAAIDSKDLEELPVNSDVNVIGSRLPGFKMTFADTPSNVTFLSSNTTVKAGQEIYKTQPLTFQDAVRDIEGAVFYDEVGNGVDTVFSLRGFAEGSAVTVILDGVRVNEVDGDAVTYPLLQMDDIDLIQVERGSASPIYGSNAFAGVVHIVTGQPSEKRLHLFGGSEWTSFQGYRFYQGFSGTLADRVTPLGGKWSYYFKGGRKDINGFRDNGEWRGTSFDIKTAYELPDEQGRFHVGIKHDDDAVSNPGALTFDQYQQNPEQTSKSLDGRGRKNTIVQLGLDKTFWDNRVFASVLAAWRYHKSEFVTTSITFADFPDGFAPDTQFVTTKSRSTDLIWQLGYQEAWDKIENQTLIGMEMRNADQEALQRDYFIGSFQQTATETDRVAEPHNIGLYWRETLKFYDRVTAHVGMRHDWHWLTSKDYISSANDLKSRWNESTISTGLTAKILESLDLFGNYSQGFRVPTISELAPFTSGINRNLNPEKSDSYEIGGRLRYQDKARLKASYFLIDLQDEIVFDSTSRTATTPFGRNINIGESRRTGIETRLDLKPLPEIDLYGSYTWTHAYVRETDGGGALIDGRSLGQIPENRWTFGTTVRPFERIGEPWEGFRIGIYGTYTGRQHPVSYESSSQATLNATGGAGHIIKGYSIWDFLLAYRWKDSEIYFKINNLFDNKYYSRSVSATVPTFGNAGVLPPGTYAFVVPGAPREFVIGLKWAWDAVS